MCLCMIVAPHCMSVCSDLWVGSVGLPSGSAIHFPCQEVCRRGTMPSSGCGMHGQLQLPQPKPQPRQAPPPTQVWNSPLKHILRMCKALQQLKSGRQDENAHGQGTENELMNSYRRNLRTAAEGEGLSPLVATVIYLCLPWVFLIFLSSCFSTWSLGPTLSFSRSLSSRNHGSLLMPEGP